ncbi:hypothetical protein EDB86DRAFT_1403730 [Lactarius hatsudake]|nr:hypothetical protein EDB86DRAFT_1403730 [Lactarius hatsudake]
MDEYDERATKFWSVYVQEAESHDKALIETWKDDMEGIIIFAGLYSASLTAFLQQSFPNLTPNYAQQSAYYSQQSVFLLAQISAQLAASGSPPPATFPFPTPLPDFQPASSDVRVNVFWFMSLVFSLTSALAATIVQQWVRDYMHVFQRYNHPLKRARVRQFLYEGAEKWYMPVVVDVVPALIHVSLFLFFIGLADYLFNINTATATTTTIMIAICAALYLWCIIAPVHDAQSPYQSPLSGIFWALFQIIRGRTHRDHSTGGARKRISTNMTDGRVQLAMDESDDRKKRDARAIRWVVDNLTEDSELEPFVIGVPGSFNSNWGKKVWEVVAAEEDNRSNSGGASTPQPNEVMELAVVSRSPGGSPMLTQRENTIGDLSGRITRLLKTCTDPGVLPTEEARRKRARACVDASLSFVLSIDDDWEWFAEPEIMSQALTYLGDVERIREPTSPGFDAAFAVRWTCMALVAVRRMLNTPAVRTAARHVITCLAEVRGENGVDEDEVAAKTTGVIDRHLKSGWEAADILRTALNRGVEPDKMEELFLETLAEYQTQAAIKDLGDAWNSLGWADKADEAIIDLVRTMVFTTGGVLGYLPTAVLSWAHDSRRKPDFGMRAAPLHLMPQFLPPRLLTQRLWLCVLALRNIATADWGSSPYQPKALGDLCAPEMDVSEIRRVIDLTPAPMKAQLWRLQDLRDGGFVSMLELFMAAVRASKVSLHHSSRPLFIGTFKSLTSDWKEHRDAPGTQRLLVHLLRQVLPKNNEMPVDDVPAYIVDKFLTFIGEMLAGKKGGHVTEALQLIGEFVELRGGTHVVAQDALLTISPPKPPKPPKRHHSAPQTDAS